MLFLPKNFKYTKQQKKIRFMLRNRNRLRANPQAKFKYFNLGELPTQIIRWNVYFSKRRICTIYRAVGSTFLTYRIRI
jgi:hypothetical protein